MLHRKKYFGKAETTFKLRYSKYQKSFEFLKYKTDTDIFNETWQMKKSGQTPVISWERVRKCSLYNGDSK